MDASTIMKLTCVDLREALKGAKLGTTGRKDELRNRLLTHHGLAPIDDSADEPIITTVEEPRYVPSKIHFTLRDVEDSLIPFTGTDAISVEDWVHDFEDNAMVVGWEDVQRFIYAKQLLRGAAKMFIRSQTSITCWSSLKAALVAEFGEKLSAAEVHRLLKGRRKQKNETLLEYLYSLAEIGKHTNLDEESLIEYFSEGIPDSKHNKLVLYQAKNLRQLKEAIRVYERVCGQNQSLNRSYRQPESIRIKTEERAEQPAQRKCYQCGEAGHMARDCKSTDVKCFKCHQTGHRSFQCRAESKPEKSNNVKVGRVNMLALTSSSLIFKDIRCGQVVINALVDTGCDVCLIRNDTLTRFGEVDISNERKSLSGIGDSSITTLGSLDSEVEIDGVRLTITFHIVRERDIDFAAVLGNSVLNSVDMYFTNKGAHFTLKDTKQQKELPEGEPNEIPTNDSSANNLFDEFSAICLAAESGELQVNSEVTLSHLSEGHARAVERMICSYQPAKGYSSPVEMKIIVKDDQPVYQRPRRVSNEDQKWIDQQVAEWLRDGIIRPSYSSYASPIVLVAKKDGSKRLCCDFRKINEKIVRDSFPMPLIDDVVERLQKAKVYTTLDLKDGFFHVPMEISSSKYTAFVTHNGQYEFDFAPFGLCNSPAVFTRFIMAVMRDLIQDGTVVLYMDDMIIPSEDEDEGIFKLHRVLKQASKTGLKIKWRKCQFLVRCVNFLGYIVERGTIKPSDEKLKAVKNFPVPVTKQGVQRFVGLTSYFRRFIEDYAIVAKPLTDIIKKTAQFEMGDEQLLAFEQLKTQLIKAPVLSLFSPTAETQIHTDACMYGYGGVLLQRDSEDQQFHPIQYMSRKTKPCEEKLHSYELEVLAVIEALKKWRVYVLGRHVRIITDCNAFAMTMRKQDLPAKVARWAMFLQEFDYTVEHRSGAKMKHVDALSRTYCLLLEDTLKHRLREAQLTDEWVKAVRSVVDNGIVYEDYYVRFDVLHKDQVKQLIVVPAAMEEEIIQLAHRQGHYAAKKTQEVIEKTYYIPSLSRKVTQVVRSCVSCIITDAKLGKKEGLLTPIDKGDRPLITYHADHVGPMEATKKSYNYILVVIDSFSKFVWLYPTKSTGTEEVLRSLAKQSAIFGNPERIITDRGTAFTSASFDRYCVDEGIQHLLIATGVPRGNGQVERVHRVVVPMIAKLCQDSPSQWYRHVGTVQRYLNNTTSRSTGSTPFRILTGLSMRVAAHPDLQQILEDESLAELDDERDRIREEAREKIADVQEENRRTFNKSRKPEGEYQLGELVAIKRTQFGSGMRLRPKYLGPYKVIEKQRHGRYKVEKVGEQEGPNQTVTIAEYVKRWR